jgi:hypothetical protein
MPGRPAALTNVTNQSACEMMPLRTVPAGKTPGQRTRQGTRYLCVMVVGVEGTGTGV